MPSEASGSGTERPTEAYEEIGEALEHLHNARCAGIPEEQTIDCLEKAIERAIGAQGRLIERCDVEYQAQFNPGAATEREHTIDGDGFLWCHATGERRPSGDLDEGNCPACGEEVDGFLTDGGTEQSLHQQYEPEKPIHRAINITGRMLKDRVEPFEHNEYDLWKARDPETGRESEHWWDSPEVAVEFLAHSVDLDICCVNECSNYLGEDSDRIICDECSPEEYVECAEDGCDFPTSHTETEHCSTHTWRNGRVAEVEDDQPEIATDGGVDQPRPVDRLRSIGQMAEEYEQGAENRGEEINAANYRNIRTAIENLRADLEDDGLRADGSGDPGKDQKRQCQACGCAESEHPTIVVDSDGSDLRCEGVYRDD